MAYDRYDTRSDRERWRGSDRDHDRDRWRGSDRGREERGFFERAGDEIASWFGGDDDRDSGRREQERMSRGRGWGSGRDSDRYNFGGWGGDSERERFASRGSSRDRFDDDDRGYRPMNWTSSDRDYRGGRSGFDRDFGGREGGSRGGWAGAFTGSDYDRRESGRSYRPMTGDYGRSEEGGYDRSETPWGRDDYRRTSFAGSSRDNDRHYQAWRQRQLNELDRDYDQYCRERQDRFENDFGSWRNERMQKRQHLGGIQEHMEVVGSDGTTIGKVDCVRGDRIILTKSDSEDNRHHAIDCSMIDTVEGGQVRLSMPAEEAKSRWHDDEDGSFERNHEGDTTLERSFAGTYR